MLAARVAARRVSRCSRSFATAVDAAGFKVAAVDRGQPTSSITVLAKAGTRFETSPGIAHVLKNYSYKTTSTRSEIGTVRETELRGGVLSASLSREYLALTAEFLRGDEEFFADVLCSTISSAKYSPWELNETVLPTTKAERTAATADAGALAVEIAHALAFRSGLGAPLFAPSHLRVTNEDVQSYASSIFTKGNIAFIGSGISQTELAKLVESKLGGLASGTAPASSPSKYFGGETRVEHDGLQTVFIGFGTTGSSSHELAVLASHLSPKPSLKWSQGTSPLSTSIPTGVSVQTVYAPYSDAALFGILVQGASPQSVKEVAAHAVKALKAATAADAVKAEDLKKAIAKAKFAFAHNAETREGFAASYGPQLLDASISSFDATTAALDKVSSTSFSKAVATLAKSTPTYVVLGDTSALPYKDEIGL